MAQLASAFCAGAKRVGVLWTPPTRHVADTRPAGRPPGSWPVRLTARLRVSLTIMCPWV